MKLFLTLFSLCAIAAAEGSALGGLRATFNEALQQTNTTIENLDEAFDTLELFGAEQALVSLADEALRQATPATLAEAEGSCFFVYSYYNRIYKWTNPAYCRYPYARNCGGNTYVFYAYRRSGANPFSGWQRHGVAWTVHYLAGQGCSTSSIKVGVAAAGSNGASWTQMFPSPSSVSGSTTSAYPQFDYGGVAAAMNWNSGYGQTVNGSYGGKHYDMGSSAYLMTDEEAKNEEEEQTQRYGLEKSVTATESSHPCGEGATAFESVAWGGLRAVIGLIGEACSIAIACKCRSPACKNDSDAAELYSSNVFRCLTTLADRAHYYLKQYIHGTMDSLQEFFSKLLDNIKRSIKMVWKACLKASNKVREHVDKVGVEADRIPTSEYDLVTSIANGAVDALVGALKSRFNELMLDIVLMAVPSGPVQVYKAGKWLKRIIGVVVKCSGQLKAFATEVTALGKSIFINDPEKPLMCQDFRDVTKTGIDLTICSAISWNNFARKRFGCSRSRACAMFKNCFLNLSWW